MLLFQINKKHCGFVRTKETELDMQALVDLAMGHKQVQKHLNGWEILKTSRKNNVLTFITNEPKKKRKPKTKTAA